MTTPPALIGLSESDLHALRGVLFHACALDLRFHEAADLLSLQLDETRAAHGMPHLILDTAAIWRVTEFLIASSDLQEMAASAKARLSSMDWGVVSVPLPDRG